MKDMKTDQRRIDPAAQRVFDIMQPRVTAEELQRIMDAYFLAQDAILSRKERQFFLRIRTRNLSRGVFYKKH